MKTAIKEFIEDLEKDGVKINIDVHYYIEKEEQQIVDAAMNWYEGINDLAGEQYYNETFNNG